MWDSVATDYSDTQGRQYRQLTAVLHQSGTCRSMISPYQVGGAFFQFSIEFQLLTTLILLLRNRLWNKVIRYVIWHIKNIDERNFFEFFYFNYMFLHYFHFTNRLRLPSSNKKKKKKASKMKKHRNRKNGFYTMELVYGFSTIEIRLEGNFKYGDLLRRITLGSSVSV